MTSKMKKSMEKSVKSRIVRTEKGAKHLEEELGPQATEFLHSLQKALIRHFGEKAAKSVKDTLYRMLVKFNDIQNGENQDQGLRFKADRAMNVLSRQMRIALNSADKKTEDQKVEVAALQVSFKRLLRALLDIAKDHNNMTKKNQEALKKMIEQQIASPDFLQKILFDKEHEEARLAMNKPFEAMFQDIMEATGEEFADTKERKKKESKEDETQPQQKLAAPMGLGIPDQKEERAKTCSVTSCGADAVYASLTFHGSPFCALHHFKAFPYCNQCKEGEGVSFADWVEKPERREFFTEFLELRNPSLKAKMSLLNTIKTLGEEKDGKMRSAFATEILNVLIKDNQVPEKIQGKIRSMISEENAPPWIFDLILPRLREDLKPLYTSEFIGSSLYKVYLQYARLPAGELEQLAWQLVNRGQTGVTDFTFVNKANDGKTKPKIDTNAVLQPFAVERDRSPTIRRPQPGDDEPGEDSDDEDEDPTQNDNKSDGKAATDRKSEQAKDEEEKKLEDPETGGEDS